jgi:uncharacterized protein YndB with AHSA1/START domain
MDARRESETTPQANRTTVERTSERELVVRRVFDAPAHIVFQAWTRPELFMCWWAPKSMGVPIQSCDMDVRTGGGYRVEFGHSSAETWTFFGKYIDVIPDMRLVWTNEESEGGAVTTVTFEQIGNTTLLLLHELYPSKEALDEALEGMEGGMPEQFEQLDALLVVLGASGGQP